MIQEGDDVAISDSSQLSVSVVIPVRNGAKFIQAFITSALEQIGVVVEVVVVDDASEDETVSVVEAMVEKDPRVRLVRLPERGGIAEALNMVSKNAIPLRLTYHRHPSSCGITVNPSVIYPGSSSVINQSLRVYL